MGNNSLHFNFLAQLKHFDWPKTIDCPVFRRKMMTLRKLPIMAPKVKIKINKKMLAICFLNYTTKTPMVIGVFVKLSSEITVLHRR